jgi:hypothetical protein
MIPGLGTGAAAAPAATQAIRASGVVVRVEPGAFLAVLGRQPAPLVVRATGWFFVTFYKYLMSYKGMAFYTEAATPLELPPGVELAEERSISAP